MIQWNCCRLCLSENNLDSIFSVTCDHIKYSEELLKISGIQISKDDLLPQKMCQTCKIFINNSVEFRIKCEENEKVLLKKLSDYENYDFKEETVTVLDIDNKLFIKTNIIRNSTEKNCKEIYTTSHEDNEMDNFDIVSNSTVKPIEFILSNDKKCRRKTPNKRILVKRKKLCIENKSNEENLGANNLSEIKRRKRNGDKVQCEVCHRVLSSKSSLINHYKTHTGYDVICEHCGKMFISMRQLLMHCKSKHGYEKTDKCKYCDYVASNSEQVKIHERLHTGERPHVCKDCGADFTRKSSYLQHVATHLPEKTVQCDKCPARFKSLTLMKVHRYRHKLPQYTFKCYVCQSNFARRRNVIRHLQRIHAVVDNLQDIERIKIA